MATQTTIPEGAVSIFSAVRIARHHGLTPARDWKSQIFWALRECNELLPLGFEPAVWFTSWAAETARVSGCEEHATARFHHMAYGD